MAVERILISTVSSGTSILWSMIDSLFFYSFWATSALISYLYGSGAGSALIFVGEEIEALTFSLRFLI